MRRLLPPCGYQGGKRKFSQEIAQILLADKPAHVYDFCAGSGAVSLSLREAGLEPRCLTMVEAGPWGQWWQELLDGSLDLDLLEAGAQSIQDLPPVDVAGWLEELASTWQPIETWLWLQAGTFGRLPVWWDGSRWRCGSIKRGRGYYPARHWIAPDGSKSVPTIASVSKILERTAAAQDALRGAEVIHGKAQDVTVKPGSTIYVDPDYQGTPGYLLSLPLEELLPQWLAAGCSVYCSEQTVRMEPDAVIELGNRRRGGIQGSSKKRSTEKLLIWRPSIQPTKINRTELAILTRLADGPATLIQLADAAGLTSDGVGKSLRRGLLARRPCLIGYESAGTGPNPDRLQITAAGLEVLECFEVVERRGRPRNSSRPGA